jgi:hypothetical protein
MTKLPSQQRWQGLPEIQCFAKDIRAQIRDTFPGYLPVGQRR